MGIILKINIMQATTYKQRKNEEIEKANLWDAFTNHMDTSYFPGAVEQLDTKLIAFEYNNFKQYTTV